MYMHPIGVRGGKGQLDSVHGQGTVGRGSLVTRYARTPHLHPRPPSSSVCPLRKHSKVTGAKMLAQQSWSTILEHHPGAPEQFSYLPRACAVPLLHVGTREV
jgi:hypothetical protein